MHADSRVCRLLAVTLLLATGLLPLTGAGASDETGRPWTEQPFLGLSVRDTADGVVVAWIRPGPLGGRGFESTAGIRRGDNVVSLDGHDVGKPLPNGRLFDADAFVTQVKAKAPGDEIVLVLRRSPEARPDAAVPQGGSGGEPFTVTATLGTRAAWAGTIGRGLEGRTLAKPAEGAYEATLLEAAGEHGLRDGLPDVGGGLDALLAHLRRVQEEALDPNALPAVVNAFRRPLSVDAVEEEVYGAVRAAADGQLGAVEALVRSILDLEDPDETLQDVMGKPAAELTPPEVHSAVRFAGQHLDDERSRAARPRLQRLVETLRHSVYVYDDHADDHVRTITEIGGTRLPSTLALALVLLRLAPGSWEAWARIQAENAVLEDLPEDVRAAVEGDVLAFLPDPLGGLAVVGGPGPNRYDMTKVSSIYDVGGDDVYAYGEAGQPAASSSRAFPPLRIVIDLAGDDHHEARAPFDGPATAVLGFSLLDDRAGDDVYRSEYAFSVGAALMGIAILRDRAGDDVYECVGPQSGWGLGCGFWGAGLILDAKGHDVYRGEKLVEGVGGPRGLGLVVDAAGRDLYVADGPHFGSAYGTPAVHVGMSQGFGIGIRGYAAGGLGAIYDLAGNDRYVAGEFSQAGGYYFGMGILHDASGHDLYHGNRYGQAFAAHQAIGVLVDDAGDDTYWSMTAASQAGTWDESIGLLLDKAGNDAYRCDGLGQGGASMQAIALLVDLQGDDRYTASAASAQGRGGGNGYHYGQTGVFSFSALLDLGGGRDAYSADRANDATRATGTYREKDPASSPLYGLFVDR